MTNHLEPGARTATGAALPGALEGMRILDFTSIVLGPMATRMLGDHGADIIKIEGIGGDLTRTSGSVRNGGLSSVFLALNRNKRSIAVDLKTPKGLEIARRLIATADVMVHNIRVAAIERLGLGYAAASAINPRLIYCAATGFGQDGPDRDKPAFDDIMQAASGIAGLVEQQQGRPDYMPTLIADKTAALAVVNAVLAAIVHRERTGHGQYVEVPMFETMVEFMLAEHMGGMSFEPQTGPAGYKRVLTGGRRLLPTSDGHIAALPYTVVQWRAFFAAVGRNEVLPSLGVANASHVNAKGGQLYAAMSAITPLRSTAQWLELLGSLDIACTPLYSLQELPEHPHLKAVGLFGTERHPTQGDIRSIRPTSRFSGSPQKVTRLAPELGQHSGELLAELGYASDEIADMYRSGVAVARPPASGPAPEDPRV